MVTIITVITFIGVVYVAFLPFEKRKKVVKWFLIFTSILFLIYVVLASALPSSSSKNDNYYEHQKENAEWAYHAKNYIDNY